MKKMLCVLLAVMLAAFALCAQADAQYQAGAYSATARGNNADLTVTLTFSDSAITAAEVTSHAETVGIADPAIERIPQNIVKGQTLAIDAIAGATNTSRAILAAAEDCVKQAGGDVDALKTAKAANANTVKPVETLETDVLVVGSGLSGLSAAVAASENGASVIVLEKMAVTGGSAKSSMGTFMTCEVEENKAFHKTQSDDTLDAALARWKASMDKSLAVSQYPDYDRVGDMLVYSMETIDWIVNQGAVFVDNGYTIANRGMSALEVDVPEDTVGIGAGKLIRLLQANAEKNGAKVYVDTPATELIIENGVVVGAKASGLEYDYEIKAKNVILACGGVGGSAELVGQLTPAFVEIGYTYCGVPGNTGDGVTMALAAGAVTYEDNWVIPSYISPAGELIAHNTMFNKFLESNGLPDPESSYDRLIVDREGVRIMNEAAHYSEQNLVMVDHNKGPYYAMYEGMAPEIIEILDTGIETGLVFKGETIAELAQNAGMDPAVLEATAARYTELAKAGKDDDFGKNPQRMFPIAEEGPYYLVNFVGTFSGSIGGVKTNENFQAVREDGSAIEGLYAVGEMANRFAYNQMYFSGSSLTFSSTMGRIAGAHAAANK